jgi:hypothetical protein
MECDPAVKAAAAQVAWLELRATTLQIVVVPSLKVTVPVGATGVLGVTVAVKVTDCPKIDGLAEGVTVVVVVAWTAVPVRLTSCCVPFLSPLSSVTTRVPSREPTACGAKVTVIVHVPCAAMGEEAAQLSLSA